MNLLRRVGRPNRLSGADTTSTVQRCQQMGWNSRDQLPITPPWSLTFHRPLETGRWLSQVMVGGYDSALAVERDLKGIRELPGYRDAYLLVLKKPGSTVVTHSCQPSAFSRMSADRLASERVE